MSHFNINSAAMKTAFELWKKRFADGDISEYVAFKAGVREYLRLRDNYERSNDEGSK